MKKQTKEKLNLGTVIGLGIGISLSLGYIAFKLARQNQKLRGEIDALKYTQQLLARHVWKSGKLVEKMKGVRRV